MQRCNNIKMILHRQNILLALLELFDGEVSPTAGFRENGSWVRIFPVPHRLMKLAKERDIFLFLGTIYKWQKMNGANPFVIIGVFYPPKGTSLQLSFDF